jgi:hypothetical protein
MGNPRLFYPNIIRMSPQWVRYLNECQAEIGGKVYAPARALGWGGLFNRFRAAWLVFKGDADALIWPGQ